MTQRDPSSTGCTTSCCSRAEPIACTIRGRDQQIKRVADFRAAFEHLLRTETFEGGFRWHFRADDEPDPSLLLRVLENVVENAVRHAPENTIIRLNATARAEHVEIRVADQGVGIAPGLRERILEPFVQLEHGERVIQRSSRGLGLTFCKVAIEAHGGRIWVENADPGAAICFTLPCAAAPTA